MQIKDLPFTNSTEQFAELNGVKPQSIRAAYCRFGSYHGIVPKKHKSGRLLWPHVQATVDLEVSDARTA